MKTLVPTVGLAAFAFALAASVSAQSVFSFSTGSPDGRVGIGSRPSSIGRIAIESADDFVLSEKTLINHLSFTGLVTNFSPVSLGDVNVGIYRVFPQDSSVPPSGQVPSRENSPSDVAFDERSSSASGLSYIATILSANFTTANSVLNGIYPLPNSLTGGEGPVTGAEVQFDVSFTHGILLPAGHYFLAPQVDAGHGSDFFWLSAANPSTSGTGPLSPDLQTWIRNESLAPDWLRVGTDITHQAPSNASFSLSGISNPLSPVPEPSTYGLTGAGILLFGCLLRKSRNWRSRQLTVD